MRWSLLSQQYAEELEDLVEGHFDLCSYPPTKPNWADPLVAKAADELGLEHGLEHTGWRQGSRRSCGEWGASD